MEDDIVEFLSGGSQILWVCCVWGAWPFGHVPSNQILNWLTVGETYLVYRPVMLVWGHSQSCEMICLLIYPGFKVWYSNWACCVSEVHNLLVMCPAQHGHVHVVTVAKLSCQWSSHWGCYPGNLYLPLLLIPYDELGKASLCQTEGFAYKLHMLNHALAMMCYANVLPIAWSFAAKILLSAATASWWWWLAPCLPSPPSSALGLVLLLLDLLLVACPSPPGLDLELQFISMVLLDDF
jgi:hypothetical protein